MAKFLGFRVALLVSTLPTFSGKLLGERVSREWVLPLLVCAALVVGLLVTYPFPTLTVGTLLYLAMIPFSLRRYGNKQRQWDAENPASPQTAPSLTTTPALPVPPTETKH